MALQSEQAFQIVRRGKHVNMRQGSAHAPRYWLITVHAQQRIEPDYLSHASSDRPKLRGKQLWLACVPSVTQNDEQCVARKQPAVTAVELPQRLPDLRPSRPPGAFL